MILHLTKALEVYGPIGLRRPNSADCAQTRLDKADRRCVKGPQDTTRIMEGIHA